MDLEQLNREAQNFKIQSIASEELSKATKRVYDGIKTCGIPHLRILVTLHDQLLFNCPKEYAEEADPLIKSWMETVLPSDKKRKLEMKITVDRHTYDAWGVGEY